jgi:spore coat protein U-like protein
VAIALVLLLGLPCTEARAQSCSFTIDNIDLSPTDILSGSAVNGSSTIHISCNGLLLNTVRVCMSIGAGSGGAVAGARHLLGPSATLNYQLYRDGAGTVWGSNYWGLGGSLPTVDIPLNASGSGSTTVPMFAQLFAAQNTAPIGSYISNFASADTIFDYGYTFLGIVGCNAIPLLPRVGSGTFQVAATVGSICHVSALDLDFGTQGLLTANVDRNGEVSVTCTNGTPYTVSLNGGQAAAPPTARIMKHGVSDQITYGIYRDAARTQPWGETLGTTEAGTGTGVAQTFYTYGRVPPQPATPGGYSDSVIVTVTY